MASNGQHTMEQKQEPPRLQIYSTSSSGISPFWREKYERDAKKYWDVFYKRHQDKFFKDRHYLDKEWGSYFSGAGRKVILEVGCGAGNTIFPLIATYSDIFINACDFSPRAIDLVKAHKDFIETRVNAFVCDLTVDDLTKQISPSSVDIVTMIFVLSAVSPGKMHLVLQNVRKVLKWNKVPYLGTIVCDVGTNVPYPKKGRTVRRTYQRLHRTQPNGYVLLRDYATGDLAQERFICKDQKISENFYVRGDGTRAFYFSDEFLTTLFKENGFDTEEHFLCCKQVENRSREIVMNRRWVQAVFRLDDKKPTLAEDLCKETTKTRVNENALKEPTSDFEIDMSEGMAVEMFGISPSSDEIIDVKLRDAKFKIKVLSKEYQHTCKSTGLMLWDSARLIASLLEANPTIVSQKRVLELGCGCAGVCSMVAVRSAEFVVATDGDSKALEMLTQNVESNIDSPSLAKLTVKRLEWGNRDHIEAIKELNGGGFEVIIGTDVTYVREAILPLFETAKEMISSNRGIGEAFEPALILCHVFRRVDENYILSTASKFGFRLVDKWHYGIADYPSQTIISRWFAENTLEEYVPTSALNIMYFQQI